MSEWKRYKVTFSKKINGGYITSSYTQIVQNEQGLIKLKHDLYENPLVYSVDFEEIKEGEDEKEIQSICELLFSRA